MQFRLSTILWVITLLAILCCWAIDRRKLQQVEAERARLNATVTAMDVEADELTKALIEARRDAYGSLPF